jgi:hypothetical protein
MSHKDSTDPIGHLEVTELPNGNLSKLTRTMLLLDPENADAQWMRSAIQSEMQRDLDNARAFLRQAHARENPQKLPPESHAPVPEPTPFDSRGEDIEPPVLSASTPDTSLPPEARRMSGKQWLVSAGVLAVVILVGLAIASLPRPQVRPNSVQTSPLPPLSASEADKQILNANLSVNAAQAEPLPPKQIAVAETPPPLPAPRPAAKLPDRPVATPVTGTLAVSSPTSVDIYKDDAYIGSVPVSLELPAGPNTLEYRHGALMKKVTHVVNGNETTRAMITFDVSVQVNSRPWAEVFLDGVERKPLGQTPLSGVRVPIGGVLVFENPQFQPKRYRVTGNETGIQMVFP